MNDLLSKVAWFLGDNFRDLVKRVETEQKGSSVILSVRMSDADISDFLTKVIKI